MDSDSLFGLFVLFLLLAGIFVALIKAAVKSVKKSNARSPAAVVRSSEIYNIHIGTALEQLDYQRARSLLQALPEWPIRQELINAHLMLRKLRNGASHAPAAGVPTSLVKTINSRATEGDQAVRRVAVKVVATYRQSQITRFERLSDVSKTALLHDAREIRAITTAAQHVHYSLTDAIATSALTGGHPTPREVSENLEAISQAAARIPCRGEDLP